MSACLIGLWVLSLIVILHVTLECIWMFEHFVTECTGAMLTAMDQLLVVLDQLDRFATKIAELGGPKRFRMCYTPSGILRYCTLVLVLNDLYSPQNHL